MNAFFFLSSFIEQLLFFLIDPYYTKGELFLKVTLAGCRRVIFKKDSGGYDMEVMEVNEAKYKKAQKRAKAKLEFLRHLVTYVIVITFLAVINNVTWGGYQWWLWAALGWGIGIVSHFFQVYAFKGGQLEEKLIEKELSRMDK
jgi:uncharacterized ion transporter superfamily protein YfcC